MEDLLYVKDYYLPVFAEQKPKDKIDDEWTLLHRQKNGNDKLFLIKKLIGLKYKDETPLSYHLNAYQGIPNQLAEMNIKFENEVHGLWLLGILPDSWETFRTSVSNSAPNSAVIMDLAKSSVLNERNEKKVTGFVTVRDLSNRKEGEE
ncbi:hypothetical protein LWI28_003145 [Acer negundo]|uniref:Uncharacterized protein n=1 Tax=Acer negundo TaxID=4023 RepID=A0AAD5IQ89_ACENE|nr:hypothetical protein LWI28_003145 [Acer negundo]